MTRDGGQSWSEQPGPSTPAPAGPLSSLPLSNLPVNSLPLGAAQSTVGQVAGAAAPVAGQRLGGLPGLGDTSALGNLTQTLPLGSLPVG